MGKITIMVRIPALDEKYEFAVPESMSVMNGVKLMIRILNQEYGVTFGLANVILIDMADGLALRPECSFRQQGIVDGANLMLY
jgi:hypothetical protein